MPTPTNTTAMMNAQDSVATGFADMSQLGGVITLMLYAIVAIILVRTMAPWLARSKLLSATGKRFATSFMYALKGTAATAVLAAIGYPMYFVSQMDPGTRSVTFKWVGIIVGVYLTLVLIGKLADEAVTRFIEAHPDYESFSDLLPDSPEEETEPEPAD